MIDNTNDMLGIGTALASALMLAAGVAVCTAATVATGGLALAVAGFALGGASIGVSMATSGMVESDRETGYVRSNEEFWAGIFTGAIAGGIAGASLYGTVAIAPTMGTLVGMSAEYYLGVSSFTQNTVPAIMTTGMNGLAAATGLYTANDIYASNGGYNVILDKVFDNNVDKYEECGILLYMLTDMAGEYVAMNSFRLGTGRGVQFEKGGSSTLKDWENNPTDLSKQAPIEIPSSATVKVQTKNGYDQISFKWTENGQNYEVRWHTKTPGAPEGHMGGI